MVIGMGCDSGVDHRSDARPDLDMGIAVDAAPPNDAADMITADVGVDAMGGPRARPNIATAATGWYRGDFHYHTTYSADAERQGGDDLETALAIADAFRDPFFLSKNPHLAGNGLDFIAVTDHRTDAPLLDPVFRHDHLILIPGEEYGGNGHANVFGLQRHIPHDPVAGESVTQRHTDAIAEAHAQGAIFSPNHPASDNPWVWNVEGYDSVEGWNGPWSAMSLGTTIEAVESRLGGAVENPYIRDAVEGLVGPGNDHSLRFWQNHLTAGVHVPLIGGGDRHMLLPAGMPTTYVRRPSSPEFAGLEGRELGYEGIIQGIREGGTFVSRSTFGAQIDLHAESTDGDRYPLGSALPHQGPWTIHARVARAGGGELRLVSGALKPIVDGRIASEPEVIHRVELPDDDTRVQFEWSPPEQGGWLHAIVLEPLLVEPIPPHAAEALATLSMPAGDDSLAATVRALMPFLDLGVAFDGYSCDPADWKPWRGQCMPMDRQTWGTFYMPDPVDRLLNAWFEDGQITDYCLGGITSAFMVRAAQ